MLGIENKERTKQPNCYECCYRTDVPGDAHSRCNHPKVIGKDENPLAELVAMLAGARQLGPMIDIVAAKELGIVASQHGVNKGWFNWPYNFDPIWLKQCDGFKQKEKNDGE